MKCPFCGAADTQVIDSRVGDEGASVREDFSLAKLRTGFQRALHKRPVATDMIDAAVERVGQKVLSLGEREVEARWLGEMVMEELRKLDKVAYIRFASVYRSFQDVDDFRDVIRDL